MCKTLMNNGMGAEVTPYTMAAEEGIQEVKSFSNAGLETAAVKVLSSEGFWVLKTMKTLTSCSSNLTCLTCFIPAVMEKWFWWVLVPSPVWSNKRPRVLLVAENLKKKNLFSAEIRPCKLYAGGVLSRQELFILSWNFPLRTMHCVRTVYSPEIYDIQSKHAIKCKLPLNATSVRNMSANKPAVSVR